jgi:predicted metalloprotease with PDZ domain
MYQKYVIEDDRGYTEAEFKAEAEAIAGVSLDSFFENYIYDTQPVDYNRYFGYAGLSLDVEEVESVSLGANLVKRGDNVMVGSIRRGTPAYEYGLNYGDVILSVAGKDIIEVHEVLYAIADKANESIKFEVLRDGIVVELEIKLTPTTMKNFKFEAIEKANKKQLKVRKKWLGA